MNYSDIENKYIKAEIKGHYKFKNALEVKKVLGYDFRTIRGFNELTEEYKKLSECLICNYINGHGLKAREEIRPTSIKRENGKFILRFKDKSYSYLYDDGTVG